MTAVPPRLREAPHGRYRIERTTETVARRSHPHIPRLHDSGDAGGLISYVMPFTEGEALRQRLDREKQLSQKGALRITREVADALGYAHRFGVAHRDVKPENVLFEAGYAIVTDVGMARAVSSTARS